MNLVASDLQSSGIKLDSFEKKKNQPLAGIHLMQTKYRNLKSTAKTVNSEEEKKLNLLESKLSIGGFNFLII